MPEELNTICAYCQRVIPIGNALIIGGRRYCRINHYLLFERELEKRQIKVVKSVLPVNKAKKFKFTGDSDHDYGKDRGGYDIH